MILASAVLVLAAGEQRTALGWVGFVGFLVSFTLALLSVLENLWTESRRRKR